MTSFFASHFQGSNSTKRQSLSHYLAHLIYWFQHLIEYTGRNHLLFVAKSLPSYFGAEDIETFMMSEDR
ncbi:hypothetical protein N7466_000704 [Penicillium verhagenii]|uniref:uncharacterized protein n=1 Tax=Penicillium verhagenii TaxID=1562060 RepID=UPI002545798F|nr:uncharacterized protein N7466_000704 [Penicillium verhagenii]KAJ5947689.1 hypothetical protein N7466_000704 [Penicillium verhagenii]